MVVFPAKWIMEEQEKIHNMSTKTFGEATEKKNKEIETACS